MANKVYMEQKVLNNITTGWCNILSPDDSYWKNGKQKSKPPQWKVEVVVDRNNKQMMDWFAEIREHVSKFEDVPDGEEPWVRSHPDKTKTNDDGEEVTYPGYEYISVMTTKDPKEQGRVVGENNKPFTDEVNKGATISLVIAPKYDDVHKYLMTFYLNGIKVHENGSGGGGGDPMALLGVTASAAEEGGEGTSFDPSAL